MRIKNSNFQESLKYGRKISNQKWMYLQIICFTELWDTYMALDSENRTDMAVFKHSICLTLAIKSQWRSCMQRALVRIFWYAYGTVKIVDAFRIPIRHKSGPKVGFEEKTNQRIPFLCVTSLNVWNQDVIWDSVAIFQQWTDFPGLAGTYCWYSCLYKKWNSGENMMCIWFWLL